MGNSIFPAKTEGGAAIPKLSNTPGALRFGFKSLTVDPRKQSLSGAFILVVEDNDVLRQGLQRTLEADGFVVTVAAHGLDALERMHAKPPDLILSDIAMPVMDGFTFFQAVRSRADWVAIPFIFLTAHAEREDVFEGRKLGAEDYLVKPVNRQELVTTIRSRLNRSQQLMLAQLKQAYRDSLKMLSNAIELRDHYTHAHVERVMDYASTIAREMGLNDNQMEALQFGSILHDIGKIYIPERVLQKPGVLNEEEWDVMKMHPVIGAELIKDISYLAPAIPVIRHHHERWDGKGYPDGLAGEAIPLEARIVAIADSLDAMTTERVYQDTCTPQEAFEKMIQASGTRYDPGIIDVFRGVWPEIKQRMD